MVALISRIQGYNKNRKSSKDVYWTEYNSGATMKLISNL